MRPTRPTSILLAAATLSAAALTFAVTPAHAESRAWSAAKKTLPANLQIVGGVSFAGIRSSALFQQMWPAMIKQAGDAGATLDAVKQTCGIDVVAQLDSLAFGGDDAQKGAMVIAVTGTTEKDIDACFQKLGKDKGKPAAIAKVGALTKYSLGDKALYVRWLGKDIFAIASDPEDKDLTTKVTGGGITGDRALKAALAGSKTDAAVWGVYNKPQDLQQLNVKMTMGYGSADVKAGSIAADVHLVLDSAKAAAATVTATNQQIATAKKSGGLAPAVVSLVNSLQIKAAGAEVVVSAQMAEKDLLGLIAAFGSQGSP